MGFRTLPGPLTMENMVIFMWGTLFVAASMKAEATQLLRPLAKPGRIEEPPMKDRESGSALWKVSWTNKFCKNGKQSSVSGQAECQTKCKRISGCPGISYSHDVTLINCYVCEDAVLSDDLSSAGFGFYLKQESPSCEPHCDDCSIEFNGSSVLWDSSYGDSCPNGPVCQNGGSCSCDSEDPGTLVLGKEASCVCYGGYTGQFCEIPPGWSCTKETWGDGPGKEFKNCRESLIACQTCMTDDPVQYTWVSWLADEFCWRLTEEPTNRQPSSTLTLCSLSTG